MCVCVCAGAWGVRQLSIHMDVLCEYSHAFVWVFHCMSTRGRFIHGNLACVLEDPLCHSIINIRT